MTTKGETKNIFPLHDVMLNRTDSDIELNVYRKSDKNDLIILYLHRNNRVII